MHIPRFHTLIACLLDNVDEPLDVDTGALLGVCFVHHVRGERSEVKHDIHVHGEVIIEDTRIDELYLVVQILLGTEIAVVKSYHVIRLGEVVGEIRADEARTAGYEHSFPVHRCN